MRPFASTKRPFRHQQRVSPRRPPWSPRPVSVASPPPGLFRAPTRLAPSRARRLRPWSPGCPQALPLHGPLASRPSFRQSRFERRLSSPLEDSTAGSPRRRLRPTSRRRRPNARQATATRTSRRTNPACLLLSVYAYLVWMLRMATHSQRHAPRRLTPSCESRRNLFRPRRRAARRGPRTASLIGQDALLYYPVALGGYPPRHEL